MQSLQALQVQSATRELHSESSTYARGGAGHQNGKSFSGVLEGKIYISITAERTNKRRKKLKQTWGNRFLVCGKTANFLLPVKGGGKKRPPQHNAEAIFFGGAWSTMQAYR